MPSASVCACERCHERLMWENRSRLHHRELKRWPDLFESWLKRCFTIADVSLRVALLMPSVFRFACRNQLILSVLPYHVHRLHPAYESEIIVVPHVRAESICWVCVTTVGPIAIAAAVSPLILAPSPNTKPPQNVCPVNTSNIEFSTDVTKGIFANSKCTRIMLQTLHFFRTVSCFLAWEQLNGWRKGEGAAAVPQHWFYGPIGRVQIRT